MKRILLAVVLTFSYFFSFAQINLEDTIHLTPVEIIAVRASDKTPVTKTNLSKATIEKNNIGQDIPFILNQTPSIIVNSDAGNGVGYTNFRLRGSDASRINVTMNGIPYNDAESQGTFFVDMPDIAASASNIQIQRGVGTSTNGSGAFAGSININTNDLVKEKSISLKSNAGSFGTFRNSLQYNSGLFKENWTIDGRISQIKSDGYIDRASSKLLSGMFSVAHTTQKNSIRLNVIHGFEETYQAWNGVSENDLKNNRTFNSAGTEKPGDPYKNEVDHYNQTHLQLFFNHSFNQNWKSNITGFYTKGKGYYEQYKADKVLANYLLPYYVSGVDTIYNSDLVRRLWLNNDFYGGIYSLHYQNQQTQLIFGGGLYQYKGQHYGTVVWTKVPIDISNAEKWYYHPAKKNDASIYSKWTQNITNNLSTYLDIQFRHVNYNIDGFRDNPNIELNNKYNFFNPKAGISYQKGNSKIYFSFGRSAKEPNRDDFEAGANQLPKPEYLNDFELGGSFGNKIFQIGANLFYMDFKDQLVLTGKINDVGAYTRTNIKDSYRAGLELESSIKFSEKINASLNLALSKNKIKNFTEFIDDYDNGGQIENHYADKYIAFSPNTIGNYSLNYLPNNQWEISLMGKYVSKQFLDNTENSNRKLNEYFTQDARISFDWKLKSLKESKIFLQVNNIFSKLYEPNGYTFSYFYNQQLTTENYYFPMSGINWMAGISLKF